MIETATVRTPRQRAELAERATRGIAGVSARTVRAAAEHHAGTDDPEVVDAILERLVAGTLAVAFGFDADGFRTAQLVEADDPGVWSMPVGRPDPVRPDSTDTETWRSTTPPTPLRRTPTVADIVRAERAADRDSAAAG